MPNKYLKTEICSLNEMALLNRLRINNNKKKFFKYQIDCVRDVANLKNVINPPTTSTTTKTLNENVESFKKKETTYVQWTLGSLENV